ncbi:unnamed protein product [Enterobius vermicularis]|uniref:MFS domain-containing protein n=1 Tax=Enterobius vermicularis TaxID=51028 RepID=A0A3P6ISB1_ENTVE|nr:unnamed protein product [Enterobius vermicularis]
MVICNGKVSRLKKINGEPAVFLVSVAIGLLSTLQPLFLYWATCIRTYNSGTEDSAAETCASLSKSEYAAYEDAVQKQVSTMKIFLQMTSGILSLIVAPIIGTWSDENGERKKPLLIGLGGFCAYAIVQLIAIVSYRHLNAYHILLFGEAILGLIGGVATIHTFLFTIVTDDSRNQMSAASSNVPIRIAISSAAQALGQMVGSLLVSLCSVSAKVSVSRHVNGYINSVFVGNAFSFVTLIYAIFAVRTVSYASEFFLWKEAARNFFYNIFEVVLKPRPGWTRFCLNLSAFSIFAEYLSLDSQLLLLFVKREPFSWSDNLYVFYNVTKAFIFTVGMIVFPLIISKTNFIGKDSVLILLGVFAGSRISEKYHFFSATIWSFFAGAIGPGYRSLLPRLVAKEETARLYTVFSLITVASPIISSVVLNNIYNLTLNVWPGFVFCLCGIIQIFVFVAQLVTHILMRQQWSKKQTDQTNVTNQLDSEATTSLEA